MNKGTIKDITELSILAALTIVLQIIANQIKFGPVSITLSLIPVLIGAICHGVKGGAILGFVNGIIILLGSDVLLFFEWNPVGTILVCLFKTTFAGIVAALVFKLFKNNSKLGSIVCSIIVPIVNTGLFVIGCLVFFMDGIQTLSNRENTFAFLILTMIGYNFIIELVINASLSIAAYRIYQQHLTKQV